MTLFDKKFWNQYNYLIVPYYPNNVINALDGFSISKEQAKNERSATQIIRKKLLEEGIQVEPKDKKIIYDKKKYGEWTFFIDIEGVMDDNVPVGIEVKLAEKLLHDRKEMYRMLGQSFVYKFVNYKNVLSCLMMVIVVGDEETYTKPEMKFVFECIKKNSIHPLYIPIK